MFVCVVVGGGGGGGVMLCPLRHTSIDGYSTERNNLGYLIATVLVSANDCITIWCLPISTN